MPKWRLVDDKDAPENLSALTDDSREKLDMLRALVPGKTVEWPVEPEKHRGFKAAVSRLATAHNFQVEVWSSRDGKIVCIRLKDAERAQTSA